MTKIEQLEIWILSRKKEEIVDIKTLEDPEGFVRDAKILMDRRGDVFERCSFNDNFSKFKIMQPWTGKQ